MPNIMQDKPAIITEEMKAALHEAGHFVICWLFGVPMTAFVTPKGTGQTVNYRKYSITPEQWRICLMGGYAAETLAVKPDVFLFYSGGMDEARTYPDGTDLKRAALLSKTATEYDTAFIVAHYILMHYQQQLAEAMELLIRKKRITAAAARELYSKWEDTDTYFPDNRTIKRCLEKTNKKRLENEKSKDYDHSTTRGQRAKGSKVKGNLASNAAGFQ